MSIYLKYISIIISSALVGAIAASFYLVSGLMEQYASSQYHDAEALIKISEAILESEDEKAQEKIDSILKRKFELLDAASENYDYIKVFFPSSLEYTSVIGIHHIYGTSEKLDKLLPELKVEYTKIQAKREN